MRVAHFIQRYPPALGGSEAYFQRLSRYLVAAGDECSVWTSNVLDLEAFWSPGGMSVPAGTSAEDGIAVHRFPVRGRVRGRRWLMKPLSLAPLRLWQCLSLPCNPVMPGMWRKAGRTTETFEIVHASAFPYAWPIASGLRLARRIGVPFFLTPFLHLGDPSEPLDTTRSQYTSGPLRWLLRQAERVFVQTQLEFDSVRELGIAPDKVVLQGLGVEPSECTGGDGSRLRSMHGRPIVGHLANNSVEKGTVDLLRAAERLWDNGSDFELLLAGPEMPNFRGFIASYRYTDRVRRLGVLTDQQKRDFFAAIDLFVLPSRSDSFGLVLLEAWANGLPVIVYRAGGPSELVHHQQDGLQSRCGDVEELSAHIARLLADAALRSRLGACGRERVARDFRWKDKLDVVRYAMLEMTDARPKRNSPQPSADVKQELTSHRS